MFFTRFGAVIAWILVGLGSLRTGLGFYLAFTAQDNGAAARTYLAAKNTGEAINEGLLAIFAGVVVGILVEISNSLDEE